MVRFGRVATGPAVRKGQERPGKSRPSPLHSDGGGATATDCRDMRTDPLRRFMRNDLARTIHEPAAYECDRSAVRGVAASSQLAFSADGS